MNAVMDLLGQFSFFKALEEEQLRELLTFIRLKKYDTGETILRKGEPGRNLYIVVSGKVAVLNDGEVVIAYLGKGEIFGEMSLISGEAVGATVQVVEPAKILYLNGEDFRRVLDSVPSLQMYLACLLAQRLARTNTTMFDELSSEIMGKLSEMSPAGLFQMFNLNQKTGVIRMDLPRGFGEVAFLEGEPIRAQYDGISGVEAFYEIMGVREGRFRFQPGLPPEEMEAKPLGDFMKLLMEGVRRIDEAGEEG
jgi:CRP-like cAMP-binding protein